MPPAAPVDTRGDVRIGLPPRAKVEIQTRDLMIATRQLEISLNSGVTLLEALSFISAQADNENVKKLFSNMAAFINEGNSFSGALRGCSDSFPRLYVNLVVGGEKSGTLAETLTKLADYMEKQSEFSKKIRSYLVYPAIIFLFAMGTLFFVTIYILPTFIAALGIPHDRLPMLTQVLLVISTVLTKGWFFMAAGALGGGWYLRRLIRSMGENESFDQFLLSIPMLGGMVKKICISRLMSCLATLLERGVPILESIRVSREVTGNSIISREVDKIYENVKMGMGVSEKIRSSPYFPPLVATMVATGEMSGRLPQALEKVSEFYDKEVDAALKDFFTSLEPLLIMVMGVIVGTVVAGMMLPVLSMSEMV